MRRTVLALVVTALVLAAAPAATGADRPPRYVALGDSYSAASGVLPPDPTAPPQCLRSTRNYPHVIAARVDVRLRDVTCGAAETGDYFEEQYDGVAPQLDALTRRTRLVTMTIGGNDQGVFIDAIVAVRHRRAYDRSGRAARAGTGTAARSSAPSASRPSPRW